MSEPISGVAWEPQGTPYNGAMEHAETPLPIPGLDGTGWLVLVGGGEFSFGETLDADLAWLEVAAPGAVGFVPAASGSQDYARHFADYLREGLGRMVAEDDPAADSTTEPGVAPGRALELIPIYRDRDARRGKNSERLGALPAVYLGGGVADHLLDALAGSLAVEALERKWRQSTGVVVAIAAAAQCCGQVVRSIAGGTLVPGFGWLPGGVVETNFDPGHDRRLRQLVAAPGVQWGLGIPTGSAILFGPAGRIDVVGPAFALVGAESDLVVLGGVDGADASPTDVS